jgi:hypothetical protein
MYLPSSYLTWALATAAEARTALMMEVVFILLVVIDEFSQILVL